MSVKVDSLIKELKLEVLVEGDQSFNIEVSDINRPGLQFAGFYNYFAKERVQIVGNAEWGYLDAMQPTLRSKRLKKY